MLQQFEDLFRTVRNLHSVTDLLKSMGEKTGNILDIEDNFRGSNQMKACVERVKSIPEANALMEARYFGPEFDLEALSKLEQGTLGHTYATVMKTLGFDANAYLKRARAIETDEDWVIMRLRKTHDIVHLLTGFGPTGGELGVLSIQTVQIGYPMCVTMQVSSLGLAFKRQPEMLSRVTDQTARGMAMGLEMKPVIAQRFEDGWDKPMQQWRKELNISNPVIDEPYSLKNRLPGLELAW